LMGRSGGLGNSTATMRKSLKVFGESRVVEYGTVLALLVTAQQLIDSIS
jgi:hypothetical protein